MTIDLEEILLGALVTAFVAFGAFLYLGAGALLASFLNLEGLAWYFTMAAWPFVLMVLFWIGTMVFWIAVVGAGLTMALISAALGVKK